MVLGVLAIVDEQRLHHRLRVLFTMLNQGACIAGWYTEVVDQTLGTGWTKTEIGTGKYYDEAGLLHAAWVRQPKYRDMGWLEHEPTIDEYMWTYDAKCYLRSPLTNLDPLLGKWFLAGGPGGNNPECKKPL
jgi:hypothetical protein